MSFSAIRKRVDAGPRLLAVTALLCLWHSAGGQTLNEAVNAQLAARLQPDGMTFVACDLLLSGDPLSDLGSGGLFGICSRDPGGSGNPSSSVGGGFAGSAAISATFGALLIEQSILYRYETDQDQRNIEISFVEDTRSSRFTYQSERPDRDFLQISVGGTFILQNGLQLGLGYRGIASHRYLSSNGVEFLFRKEF